MHFLLGPPPTPTAVEAAVNQPWAPRRPPGPLSLSSPLQTSLPFVKCNNTQACEVLFGALG